MVECKDLKITEYTQSVSPDGVYMRQIDAEMRFLQLNVCYPVTLNKVICSDFKRHLLWCARLPDQTIVNLPVFTDDLGIRLPEIVDIEPVTPQTFLYKDARCYIVHLQKNGRMNVRLLTLFWHQSYVDAMCRAQGFEPQEIYLVRLLDLYSRKEMGICWQIVYTDDVSEDNGMILAVDLMEAERFADINLNKLDYIPIHEGEYVNIRNTRYRVLKTEKGSYFLGKTLLQVSFCKSV